MERPSDAEAVPRAVLIAAGLLVGCSLLAAYAARSSGIGATVTEQAPVMTARDLRFSDRADGTVAVHRVLEGGEEHLLAVAGSGDDGFVRGVLRGLARERRQHGVGAEVPFRLAEHADGALSLSDPSTGRYIDLRAFGPTNTEAFKRFLRDTRAEYPRSRLTSLAATREQ